MMGGGGGGNSGVGDVTSSGTTSGDGATAKETSMEDALVVLSMPMVLRVCAAADDALMLTGCGAGDRRRDIKSSTEISCCSRRRQKYSPTRATVTIHDGNQHPPFPQ